MMPKLRFQEFNNQWQRTKLGSVFASVNSGKSKKTDLGQYPLLGSTGVIGFTDEILPYETLIIVARVGANAGLVNLYRGKYGATDNSLVLIPNDDIDATFTSILLMQMNLMRYATGSGQPLVTGGLIKSLNGYFPSISEQKKIGQFISLLDQKINLLTKKKEALETYKKGLMQKIFSQELRFKREDGTDYPDWQKFFMGQLFENISTNSLSRALLYENGDVLNLHYGDIHLKYSGLLDISKAELPFALQRDYKFKESSRMETGDMIFADAAEDYEGIGKAVEIGQTDATPSYAGLHTIHLKSKTDVLASGYMGYLSQANAFRRKVWFIAQGAKVLGISSKELLKQSVLIPKKEEQESIVKVFEILDSQLKLTSELISKSQLQKKGLLQQMFV